MLSSPLACFIIFFFCLNLNLSPLLLKFRNIWAGRELNISYKESKFSVLNKECTAQVTVLKMEGLKLDMRVFGIMNRIDVISIMKIKILNITQTYLISGKNLHLLGNGLCLVFSAHPTINSIFQCIHEILMCLIITSASDLYIQWQEYINAGKTVLEALPLLLLKQRLCFASKVFEGELFVCFFLSLSFIFYFLFFISLFSPWISLQNTGMDSSFNSTIQSFWALSVLHLCRNGQEHLKELMLLL